jgi:hypothetical protein
MATDDGDVLVGGIGALDLRNKAGCTNNIECGDTEETLGVIDALRLEDLGSDRDGGVDL